MNYCWSKWIPEAESEAWEEKLFALGLVNLVFLGAPGKRTQIQGYFGSAGEAESLRRQFGGKVAEARLNDWLEGQAVAGEKSLLKIRDVFVITMDPSPAWLKEVAARFPGRKMLQFPPGLAFGTGDHATTATCLRLLTDEGLRRRGSSWSHLDLGTGTGILAVASQLLGARPIVATDLDSLALNVARESLLRHGLSERDVDLRQEDVLQWKPGRERYDVITANIYSAILVQILARVTKALAPNGTLILSGILHHQAPEVIQAAREAGLALSRQVRRGKWATLLMLRI